jgi:hypothetical protein
MTASTSELKRSYLLLLTYASWLLAVTAGVGMLNMVVDPLALYGTGRFPALVRTDRSTKVQLMKSASLEALVLGSSRAMSLEPHYIADKVGLRGFNATVSTGLIEDSLAFLGYAVQDLGRRPKLVILGLDLEAFHNARPTHRDLLSIPVLASKIGARGSYEGWADRLKTATMPYHTFSSLRSLYYAATRYPPMADDQDIAPDGLVHWRSYEKHVANGTFSLHAAMLGELANYQNKFVDYKVLAPQRVRMFEELVREARRAGARVIVYTTPIHPLFAEMLDSSTPYRVRGDEVAALMKRLAPALDFEFFDMRDPRRFDADLERDWIDGAHMSTPNARRLLDAILAPSSSAVSMHDP